MALRITEFFGYTPLDPAGQQNAGKRHCPFVGSDCIKPRHGACSVRQLTSAETVVCCPNRLYADNYKILNDIAHDTFGSDIELISADAAMKRRAGRAGVITGREVAVFGRYWGQELPLPRPPSKTSSGVRAYFVDWILAKLDKSGGLHELIAVEVQTIDTTGNYSDQASSFFKGQSFSDKQGRSPGYSDAGMNWENVSKRILPQIIYKGHVLRREEKCSKGLYFVCPEQVYQRIRERLGGNLHTYKPGNGTITFRSYQIGEEKAAGQMRELVFFGQFTTTVDQVALAFTSPMNLPDPNVYESAIRVALHIPTAES